MPKKTTILILLLALVTAVLVFFAVSSDTGLTPTSRNETGDGQEAIEKTATVFFNPQTIDAAASTEPFQSVDIMVDTGNSAISGVQAELQFNPAAITNVRLEPEASAEGFFGSSAVILFNDVNLETGRISYAITIGANQEPLAGAGKIATLFFQPAANASASTKIEFLNKTLVTMLGENESILKNTVPLNVVLPSVTNQQTLPPGEQQIVPTTPATTLPPQDSVPSVPAQ